MAVHQIFPKAVRLGVTSLFKKPNHPEPLFSLGNSISPSVDGGYNSTVRATLSRNGTESRTPTTDWKMGRGRKVAAPIETGFALQRLGRQLSSSLNLPRSPKGLFRFRSHEEADAWLMNIWTTPKRKSFSS